MTSRRKFPAFRSHTETFTDIYSDPANQIEHERRRPHPAFADAELLDWSRTLKRKDLEHRDAPERFQALVAYRTDFWHLLGKDAPAVCFVVFSKINHRMKLTTIRYATEAETNLFYG